MNQMFSSIIQIGVIVSNAAETVTNLERILGWKPACSRETMRIPGRTYRGQEEDFACLMFFYQFAQIELEIIQPLCGKSCWNDFLSRHGNGIHHLLFDLSDSNAAIKALSGHGIEIKQRGRALPYGEHAFWAYLCSQEQLGFDLEITNRSEHPRPISQDKPLYGTYAALQGVGIAVRNLDSSMQSYQTILGWNPSDKPFRVFGDQFQGKESSALSGAVAYCLPNLAVELIRPVCGASSVTEQLTADGEGILCIDFTVNGPGDVRLLTDQGIAILERGHTLKDQQLLRWVLFDTKALFGFHLRALYR